MSSQKTFIFLFTLLGIMALRPSQVAAQDMPVHYPMLELFTNTPCPICGSQNPGFFSRLADYDGQYHLISFYPGTPYNSCIFYQANIAENMIRFQHYTGDVFGTPTVAIDGIDFRSPVQVTNTVLDNITGGISWLHVNVEETTGTSRDVTIALTDHVGGSMASGRLFAVIVERQIMYAAPNGETVHHNVFRRFLTPPTGETVSLMTGTATREYTYNVEGGWNADEIYIIAWLADPVSGEIFNSGTRFDPDLVSSVRPGQAVMPLQLYPNPATTEVFVSLPGEFTRGDLRVFDQTGREVVFRPDVAGSAVHIDLSGLPAGLYQIRLDNGRTAWGGSFQLSR